MAAENPEDTETFTDLEYEETDAESLASLETDDGENHPPEKILGQWVHNSSGTVWFLVKWLDCPLIRSSWEKKDYIESDFPRLLDAWKIEQQRQAEGKSKSLDIDSFNQAVLEYENAERQRRSLRRLRRITQRVLSIVTA